MQSAFLTFKVETHKTRALLNVVDEWWAIMSFSIMRLHWFGRRTCEKLQYLSKLTYMSYYFNTVALFHRLWSTDIIVTVVEAVVDTWENSFDYERSVNCKLCSTVNVWLGRFIQLSAWRLPAQEAPSVSPIIMLLNAADNNNLDIAWEPRQGRRRVAWRRRRRRAVWSGGEDRRPAFTS